MLSQFENKDLEDYFLRLNAQLKKMPPEVRHETHRELRQHLDALAAAHEELGDSPGQALRAALAQFGEPERLGRRLFCEWRAARVRKVPPPPSLALGLASLEAGLLFWYFWVSPGVAFGHSTGALALWPLLQSVPIALGAWAGSVLGCRAIKPILSGALPLLGLLAVGSAQHLPQFRGWTESRPDLVAFTTAWLLWIGLSGLASAGGGAVRRRAFPS